MEEQETAMNIAPPSGFILVRMTEEYFYGLLKDSNRNFKKDEFGRYVDANTGKIFAQPRDDIGGIWVDPDLMEKKP